MKKILLFAAVVGFTGMAFGADKESAIPAPKQTEQAKVEKPLASKLNDDRKEFGSTVAKDTKNAVKEVKKSEEVKKTVEAVKDTGSNLNKLRKKFI